MSRDYAVGSKQGYKQTEIGLLPEKWDVVRIADIAQVKGGKRLPKDHKLVESKTQYPYIRVLDFKNMSVDIGNLMYLTSETHEMIKPYKISSNDVYVSIAGTVGLAGTVPEAVDGANLTENAAKLCELMNVSKKFLAYTLNSPIAQRQIHAFAGRAQQPKLALFRIEKIKLPLPPLAEQKKIAEVLSTVDEAIEKVDLAIEQTERLKKGLMQELLTKGIGHKGFKETRIGRMPKEWHVVKAAEIIPDKKGAIKIGPFGSQLRKNEMVAAGVKVYGQENVINRDFRLGERYIGLGKFSKLKSVETFPGDVLITMMGSVGYSCVFPEQAEQGIMDSHLLRIQVNRTKCLPEFLSTLFNESNKINYQIKAASQGAIMSGLNSTIVRSIRFPLPSIHEQKKIVQIMNTIEAQFELYRKKREALNQARQGLMHDLLIGRKRLKVET